MNIAIIIPARYGSTRFPGKPLIKIGGQSMLSRVVDIARKAAAQDKNIYVAVATEDQRIADHCAEINVPCYITSKDCPTGSDRVLEASEMASREQGPFDFIFGLQGDAPFTPPDAIAKMIKAVKENPEIDVITPIINLRWTELDALREAKKQTPFSGTTATITKNGRALWFSKKIIPAIRKEDELRTKSEFSPINQHIGLYGYKANILKQYVSLSQSHYENLEGLEQLRFIENDIAVHTVKLEVDAGLAQAGIDSPEDVTRAEKLLAQQTA